MGRRDGSSDSQARAPAFGPMFCPLRPCRSGRGRAPLLRAARAGSALNALTRVPRAAGWRRVAAELAPADDGSCGMRSAALDDAGTRAAEAGAALSHGHYEESSDAWAAWVEEMKQYPI
jgi:hypothetical protein